jgi:hypothetical protein
VCFEYCILFVYLTQVSGFKQAFDNVKCVITEEDLNEIYTSTRFGGRSALLSDTLVLREIDMDTILATVILPASSVTDAMAKNDQTPHPFPLYLAPPAYEAFRNCFVKKISLADQGKSCVELVSYLAPSTHHPRLGMVKSKGPTFMDPDPSRHA